MKIKKLETKELVMFPRSQQKGVTAEPVERTMFEAVQRDVPGMGAVWSLRQTAFPHIEVQVIKTRDTQEFDRLLGTALGMQRWAEYIEGRTDFFVMVMGTQESIDWTKHDPHKTMERVHEILRLAARWWNWYGKKNIL